MVFIACSTLEKEASCETHWVESMDGASKFVRGDAIAGIIILAVNIFGGIVLGVTRHDMSLAAAANVFTKLSVGDGLVSQIPLSSFRWPQVSWFRKAARGVRRTRPSSRNSGAIRARFCLRAS